MKSSSSKQKKARSAASKNASAPERGGVSVAFYFFLGTLVLSLLTLIAALFFM